MINSPMMAAAFMLAQYGYGAPPPSSYEGASGQGLDTAPFVQLQRKCFDKAVGETQGAAQDVKQQRFDTCFALHDAMVKHATAKLSEKEAAGAKHDIDRALGGVEKSYAKKLGATMPEGAK
jgi:hypothetical protein